MLNDPKYDIAIMGAGVFGLSVAYWAALAGYKVIVLEKDNIGGGASGGVVGAMAPHTPDEWNGKKAFQLTSLLSAEPFWNEVDGNSGLKSGYGRIGRLIPLSKPRELELALMRQESSKSLWPSGINWKVIDQHKLIPNDVAPLGIVHEELSARIFPRGAVLSLAQACRNLGAVIQEGCEVDQVDTHSLSGIWGKVQADWIVLAGGVPGFSSLSKFLKIEAGTGVKGQAALLDIDLGGFAQIFADGIYIIPHENGLTAVGSTSENKFLDPMSVDHQLDDVLARAKVICPQIEGASVLEKWAGLRPKARRRSPMIGPLPDHPSILAAAGGYKIGFGIAHHTGRAIIDMIEKQPHDLPDTFLVENHLKQKG